MSSSKEIITHIDYSETSDQRDEQIQNDKFPNQGRNNSFIKHQKIPFNVGLL